MTTRKAREAQQPKDAGTEGAAGTPDFEQALCDLEAIVEQLEQGDLPLEESLQAFERGVALTRQCQVALKHAEQKVEILLRRTGQPEPFDNVAGSADAD